MKATRKIGWLVAVGLVVVAPAVLGDPEPDESMPRLARAEVTIPYSEMKALWEAARMGGNPADGESDPKPPVAAVINFAEYEVALAPENVTLEARYQVTSLVDTWQTIPLLGGEVRLEGAETGRADLLWQDGGYCLLTEGRGEHEITLKFAVSRQGDWLRGLRLRPGTATRNHLRVTGLPAGKGVRIAGLQPTHAGEGTATFHLPGQLPELVVSIERAEDLATPAELAPPIPSTWDIQSEVFVRYHEGRLHYESTIYCQADEGSGLSMKLQLPQKALGLTVHGDDVAESQLGPRGDGRRTLRVDWRTRDILDRKLQVRYEVPQSPLAVDWTLEAPMVDGEGETKSLFAIQAVDGLELLGENLRDSVQSRRLPEWLRTRIGPRDFLTAEAAAVLDLRTHWLPRIETAQAMVSVAEYDSRVVQDGALLVHAEFTIQHQAPMAWRVRLPAIDEILSCDVNGTGVRPVRRGEDEIEFSLGQPAKGASKVAFSFAAHVEAFDPVSGRLELSMPMTDLFIHELRWTLTIPAEFEAELQGNVEIDRQADGPTRLPNVIPLRKELVRGEHPAVEIHYKRRGLSH